MTVSLFSYIAQCTSTAQQVCAGEGKVVGSIDIMSECAKQYGTRYAPEGFGGKGRSWTSTAITGSDFTIRAGNNSWSLPVSTARSFQGLPSTDPNVKGPAVADGTSVGNTLCGPPPPPVKVPDAKPAVDAVKDSVSARSLAESLEQGVLNLVDNLKAIDQALGTYISDNPSAVAGILGVVTAGGFIVWAVGNDFFGGFNDDQMIPVYADRFTSSFSRMWHAIF